MLVKMHIKTENTGCIYICFQRPYNSGDNLIVTLFHKVAAFVYYSCA